MGFQFKGDEHLNDIKTKQNKTQKRGTASGQRAIHIKKKWESE